MLITSATVTERGSLVGSGLGEITSLFANGEQGIIIDPYRIGSLSQDSAGSTPVTAAGQSVGLARDMSGRGNNASQATALARPVYQVASGRAYLAFDGVDDFLSSASVTWATDEVTVIAAMWRNQNTNTEDLIGFGSNPTVNNGTWVLAATPDAASNNIGMASKGAGSNALARAGSSTTGTAWVVTGQAKISTDTCLIRRNGAQQQAVATDQGAGIYAAGVLNIGRRSTGFRPFNGRLYGLFAINRLLTSGELAQVEAWAASRAGITI